MSIQRQLEREQDILDGELENGYIDNDEYIWQIDDLERDYRAMTDEAREDELPGGGILGF